MAHRKPLGTTFTGPLDWPRGLPRIELDDYLRSAAGTWYRAAGVHETPNLDKQLLTLERIASPTGVEGRALCPDCFIEDGAIRQVHHFVWYPRVKRR